MANQILYGFVQLKDLANRRVTEVGVQVVNDAINESLAEYNRQIDAILALFAERTTQFKERFVSPVVARLQPLDENGRARPIKPFGQYDVAYPLQNAGTAWGATYMAREKMTVQEANDITATLIGADARWMRDHVLAALFANVAWTFSDPIHGALTVQGLANDDTVQYFVQAGADQGATDDHYLGQANAIDDSNNPFPAIREELMEHPENSGDVIAFVPTGLRDDVQGLTTFYPNADPNIRAGADVSELTGSLNVALPSGPGSLLGYDASGVWIAEWKSLPENRIVAIPTGGERPLKLREDETESLRGFKKVGERNDHPFYESQYLRIAGFGANNRVGAVVIEIQDATYDIPTGYESPMP